MAVDNTDIKFYQSGGSANTKGDASLGGAPGAQISNAMNVFDKVKGLETKAGSTEYRCAFAKNDHATQTMDEGVIYVENNTPDPNSRIEIGLATEAAAAAPNVATINVETESPASVVFSVADGLANAISLGDLPAQQYKGVWIKRVITAGNTAKNVENARISIEGDTAE